MDENTMESYLNKVDELVIDENKIVTYKSLSKSLGIHVNTAKQLLYTYVSREKSKDSYPLSATYLLAGKLQDGSFNISIVNDDDLKSIYSKFVEITSEHVYSIQKCKNLKDMNLLCGSDKESSNVERPPVIKCSKSVLKSNREVKKKTDEREDKNKKVIESALAPVKQPVKTNTDNFTSKENISKSPNKKSPSKKSPKGSSTKGQTDSKKPMGNIANLFAKAAQRNQEKSVKSEINAFDNKQKKGQTDSNDISANPTPEVEVKVKIEKKSPKKTNETKDYSKKKNGGNKRKRIQMLSDSEDSESSNDEEKEEEKLQVEEDSPLPFVENMEENKEEEKESLPRNKRKKRKVIDRTVMNEDGYLETKKEIVFETDSEDEIVDRKPDTEQKKAKIAPVIDKGKASAQIANAAKKQSSLLNFFKKN